MYKTIKGIAFRSKLYVLDYLTDSNSLTTFKNNLLKGCEINENVVKFNILSGNFIILDMCYFLVEIIDEKNIKVLESVRVER